MAVAPKAENFGQRMARLRRERAGKPAPRYGSDMVAGPFKPIPAEERAARLLTLLQKIKTAAHAQTALPGIPAVYHVEAVAIEGWLANAIATADVLAAELRGDAPDPGGDHGGVAD